MKVSLLIFFLFSSGSPAACLQDSLVLEEKARVDVVDIRRAESAVDEFQMAIGPEVPGDLGLVVRLDSLNSRVNADVVRSGNQVVIQVLGGMLKHEKMTPEALQLLLCHEIGHLLGGTPLKSRNGWSSTEGQSDYFSGLRCARLLGFDEASFTDAALKLTGIYAEVMREAPPRLDQCEERTVQRTNYGYPTVQCRLDTLLAGWRGMERPRCWFYE